MHFKRQFLLAIALGTLCLVLPGCSSKQARAKHEIELGKNDYQSGRYESAIHHFKRAAELDPKLPEAVRLMLIVTPPGQGSDEGKQYAKLAIQEYENVLKVDPDRIEAVEGLAYLHYWSANYAEAKRYYLRASQLDAKDPDNFYSAAVIDWRQCYANRMSSRTKRTLMADVPFIRYADCKALRDQNLPLVEEGTSLLSKALELRPDYKDAMAYLNLMYRERADIECGDPAAYKRDIRQAEYWVDRATAAAKTSANQP